MKVLEVMQLILNIAVIILDVYVIVLILRKDEE